jgi:hypothetical protein
MRSVRNAKILLIQSCFVLAAIGCNPDGTSPAANSSGGAGGPSGTGGSSSTGGSPGSGGTSVVGGTSGGVGSGGAIATGGTRATGGTVGTGGTRATGGTVGTGGSRATGGTSATGGSRATGGTSSTGGTQAAGGASGGATATGGASGAGGVSAAGGTSISGGTTGTGGATTNGSCSFTVIGSSISSKMATVGIVEWSTTLASPSSAQIVYTLDNPSNTTLNKGGTAPVDLSKPNYRTLLLGLKQSSDYTFHIEATASNGTTCKSGEYTLPKTGTLSGAPTVTRTPGTSASAQANGFIVTSSGQGGGSTGGSAYIIDADGAIVWYSTAPSQCGRARMDYEGVNMWMVSINVGNGGGEMRFVSMDGQTTQTNVSGLSGAHHDFTVLPGKVAAMVWTTSGRDPESNLVERASDGSGSSTTVFKIGSNLYTSSSFHCNSILYHSEDDTYTISDRNPNLYVKVKHDGTPVWQIGGSCTGAMAPKCASGTWQVNHGHDFDADKGTMLIFNNGAGYSRILELKLTESSSAISYTTVKEFSAGISSNTLGDVQRLPNGNTLITYTNAGQILEVDSAWSTVQTLKGSFGYADWRPTLYGPPLRY